MARSGSETGALTPNLGDREPRRFREVVDGARISRGTDEPEERFGRSVSDAPKIVRPGGRLPRRCSRRRSRGVGARSRGSSEPEEFGGFRGGVDGDPAVGTDMDRHSLTFSVGAPREKREGQRTKVYPSPGRPRLGCFLPPPLTKSSDERGHEVGPRACETHGNLHFMGVAVDLCCKARKMERKPSHQLTTGLNFPVSGVRQEF